MQTITSSSARARAVASVGPMFWQQTKAEFLKLARTPSFIISSLALPVMLFTFFGLRDPNAVRASVDGMLRRMPRHPLMLFVQKPHKLVQFNRL